MKSIKTFTWKCHASTYIYVAAAIFLLIGYSLMCADGSEFTHFRPDIFSPLRVRVAPMLCLAGYLLVACGIMTSQDSQNDVSQLVE